MKTFAKILAGIFIIIWILIAACYIYIKLNGRPWLITTLTQVFEQPVGLKDIHFLFPLGARITDLNVGGILEVKDVQFQIGLPDLLHQRFHLLLLNLSEPVATIQRSADSKIVLGNSIPLVLASVIDVCSSKGINSQRTNVDQPAARLPARQGEAGILTSTNDFCKEKVSKETPGPSSAKNPDAISLKNPVSKPKKSFNLMVDYLLVTKGEIKFLDHSRERNFQLTLRDVNLKAQNAAVPVQSVNTKFDLNAVLFKNDLPFSGSRIQARGWANFFEKNMQATLDVIEPDGKVGLSARLAAKNNDMAIDGKVHITNLIPKASAQADEQASLKGLIFSSLQSSGVEIAANFHSHTKMDDVQFDSIFFSGNVGYNAGVDAKNIGEHFEELGKKFYKENIQAPASPPRRQAGGRLGNGQELMNKEVPASP